MKKVKYDIFISYRHDGGQQYARTLQLMLERKGYKVFLDYDELRDGLFSPALEAAIIKTPIYMIVLSKGSMARCANEGDWVRREIEIALENGKRIVPVNPDGTFDGIPDTVPKRIKDAIGGTQHSDINFGQALNATVDLMVKNRIKPYIYKRSNMLWYGIGIIAFLIICVALFGVWKNRHYAEVAHKELQNLKEQTTFQGESISWADNVTKEQVLVAGEIFRSMQPIEGGEFIQGATPLPNGSYDDRVEPEFETPAFKVLVPSFYIGKFEVTTGQWNAIMDDNREGNQDAPIASVTFDEAKQFIERLYDLTLIPFRLPSESEWEYAAKGGNNHEEYIYAGGDNADEVAWYKGNSKGIVHSDLRPTPTANDIFNMSGNLSEWCDTRFETYDKNNTFNWEDAIVIRGGNYDSEPYELTVTHREPAAPDTSIPTLGFRLAINKIK